ncbi:MAG: hypothetical protein IH603_19140 [Burkholderia vietnamiensis]|nr:hypothetical protein [Burkholderia vietnamiensis]
MTRSVATTSKLRCIGVTTIALPMPPIAPVTSATRLFAMLDAYEPVAFTLHTVLDRKVLRKELEQIRKVGYMLSEQQLEPGMRGVSVSLRDHEGSVVAALSVSMPIGRESANTALARVLPVLQETAGLLRPVV